MVVALAGDVPQAAEVLAAVVEGLAAAGVAPADTSILHGRSLAEGRPVRDARATSWWRRLPIRPGISRR